MHTADLQAGQVHTEPHELIDRVELYKCQSPPERPGAALPPIRADLVTKGALKGLLALLSIFFPMQKERLRIKVEWGAAWIEIRHGLFPSLIRDSFDLIQLIPDLNQWLKDWVSSSERGADLQPEWARRRGLSDACVRQIAKSVVKHLAAPSRRTIRVADAAGREAELQLPARAQLVAPEATSLSETEVFRVDATQTVATYMTRNGRLIIATFSDPEIDSTDSLEIDLRALDQVSITSSRHLRPMEPEIQKESGG